MSNTPKRPAVVGPLEPSVGPHAPRHPTLAECEAAGRGPENYPGKPFEVGGLDRTREWLRREAAKIAAKA